VISPAGTDWRRFLNTACMVENVLLNQILIDAYK